MRYFVINNADLRPVAAGLTFVFEPVQNRGGSWLGVLAVEDDSAASALALVNASFGVGETTAERYDSLKKKLVGTLIGTSASPPPRRVPLPAANVAGVRVVELQGRAHGVGNPMIQVPVAPEPPPPPLPTVSLQSSAVTPPFEPLLDLPSVPVRRKSYTAKNK